VSDGTAVAPVRTAYWLPYSTDIQRERAHVQEPERTVSAQRVNYCNKKLKNMWPLVPQDNVQSVTDQEENTDFNHKPKIQSALSVFLL
jgi:hypothetical protein